VNFPFPVLVCDIGGTNARFALARSADAPMEAGLHLSTKDISSFEAAVSMACAACATKPRSMIVCAAGPISGCKVKLTNAAWTIDGARAAAHAGLEQGLLLNDFEAQALTLPVLESGWTLPIGPAIGAQPGPRLVLGLGTGFGAAALVAIEGRHLALASEAGHMDFGPRSAEEAEVWRHIEGAGDGRVSAETILSGPGLTRLHRARCNAAGLIAPDIDSIGLTERAHAQPEGEEARTLRLLWTLAGRFAGDLALAFLAKGGVTFSGGLLPRLTRFLDPEAFRANFEDKAPYRDMMRGIETRLIIAEDVALSGLAAVAAAPQNYAIDYARRAWR